MHRKRNQVAPENAYVAYGDSQFEIVPETEGSKLDLKNAYNVLSEAVSGNKTSVDFDSEPDVYVKQISPATIRICRRLLMHVTISQKQALRILLEMKRKPWMEIRSRTG